MKTKKSVTNKISAKKLINKEKELDKLIDTSLNLWISVLKDMQAEMNTKAKNKNSTL